MATTVNKYLDNADFLLATAVYDDAALTTASADGFYQQNGIYREQLGGSLVAGSATCPSCSGSITTLRLNSVSETELCCGSTSSFTAFFDTGDSWLDPLTTVMYQDPGLLVIAPDGWYRQKTVGQYRQVSLGVLGGFQTCPSCPPSDGFYISGSRQVCSDFCNEPPNYLTTAFKSTDTNHTYADLTIGDVILGGSLVNGYYAYADTSGVSTPNGVFRIMELDSNEVVDILQCDNGNCVNL